MAINEKGKQENSVIALSALEGERVVLVITIDEKSRDMGIKAGELVKIASTVLGGGGGGKDDFAQGGGPNIAKLNEAIAAISDRLSK